MAVILRVTLGEFGRQYIELGLRSGLGLGLML